MNGRAIDKYCQALIGALKSKPDALAGMRRAGDLVQAERGRSREWREPPERTKSFTAALIDRIGSGGGSATSSRASGTVENFTDVLGYGWIKQDEGDYVFVHHTGILGTGWRTLAPGDRVKFAMVETAKGIKAVEVEKVTN